MNRCPVRYQTVRRSAGGFSRAATRPRREPWLIRTLRGGGGTSTVANGRAFGSAPSSLQSGQSAQTVHSTQIAGTTAPFFSQPPAAKPLEQTHKTLANFLTRAATSVLAGRKGGKTIVPAADVRQMLENLPRTYLLERGLDADCTLRISCINSAAGSPLFLVHSSTADITVQDSSEAAARWAVLLAVMGRLDAYMATSTGVNALFLPDFRDVRDLSRLWELWTFQFQRLFISDLVFTKGDGELLASALSWRGLPYCVAAVKVWSEIRDWSKRNSDFLANFGSPRGAALMQCILTSIVEAEEDHSNNYAQYIPTAYYDWARVLPSDDVEKGVWIIMACTLWMSQRHSAMLLFPDADHVYNPRIAIFTNPDLQHEITVSNLAENGPPERLWVVRRNVGENANVRPYELKYVGALKANRKDDSFALKYEISEFGKECADLFNEWGRD